MEEKRTTHTELGQSGQGQGQELEGRSQSFKVRLKRYEQIAKRKIIFFKV